MRRRTFLSLATAGAGLAASGDRTILEIRGDRFFLGGQPTYGGRTFEGSRIEGLLMNSRMVQGIFDDENPATTGNWKYADTGRWDPERNTREFVAAMPEWRRNGLLSFDICLQGGNPRGYLPGQPWRNSAFRPDGSLKPASMAKLERILDRADSLGMAPMVCLFYFGQDEHFESEAAIRRGVREAVAWLQGKGYRNILLEIANECDNRKYEQPLLQPGRILELFDEARAAMEGGPAFPVSVSFCGGVVPPAGIAAACDYLLLHGNGVKEPARIARMVEETRALASYRGQPVLFNEDDHFDFDRPENNMLAAVRSYCSWGLLDIEGYQWVPVHWGIDTERKKQFFALLRRVTGA
jgi:hypothetical protein